jgi:hypothetical protein
LTIAKRNRLLSLGRAFHLYECEAAGPVGRAVHGDCDCLDIASLAEQLAQFFLSGAVRQIANE